jgi:uncharacterized protein with ParB-like and HNH nuclease domain/5-methylcytosine-specific restriction endonuclease McrA
MSSIISLLEQTKRDEIVLPAIQRDFVWSEEKIGKLLDSIMREYPIGIMLLWETYNDIQYRYLVKDYRLGTQHTFHDNRQQKRLKLVLDGQQRLQSLYIALYGSYEGKYLYFDILSGLETPDFKEDKFLFYFFTPEEADKRNKKAISDFEKSKDKKVEDCEAYYYCRVQDLISMGAWERQKLQQDIVEKLKLSDEDELRLGLNLSILRDVLFLDRSILKVTIIDEYKPRESRDRKSEADILEAFVRINREGTPLGKSDLFFSMLKLNWKESAETLPEFVKSINEENSFELDADFVIRCLFAVSDLGTKFDVDFLRKQSSIEEIKKNFLRCCNAIRFTVDFVQNGCRIASSRLLRGYNNLIPFVYYLFHTPDHQVPNSEVNRVRKVVYLFSFTSPFSRYADYRLGKFIREVLKPVVEKHVKKFPLEESLWWVWQWQKFEKYGTGFLQGNPLLALYLIQRRSRDKVHYDKNTPQIDHIFPLSELRKRGYDEIDTNHFANLWILEKNKNQNRNNKHPKEYFKDVSDSKLQRAFIDRNLLDYEHYKTFLKNREVKILELVKKELKLSDSDFDVSKHWKIDSRVF